LFSDAHLEQLRSFPDIDRDQLIRFFTLTPAEVAFIDPGRGRGPADRLGLAVQLCTLPWLGFVPDEVTGAPGAAVYRLAERLQVDPGALAGYGRRGQTRTDHLRLVAGYLGWHQAPPGSVRCKELRQFLPDRAMEHDSPTLLFNVAPTHQRTPGKEVNWRSIVPNSGKLHESTNRKCPRFEGIAGAGHQRKRRRAEARQRSASASPGRAREAAGHPGRRGLDCHYRHYRDYPITLWP
jgi:hypothetical protein